MFPPEGIEFQMGFSPVWDLHENKSIVLKWLSLNLPKVLFYDDSKEQIQKNAYWFKNMDVLVSGDQMGAFCYACSCLQFVPCQHPDLSDEKNDVNKKNIWKIDCCSQKAFNVQSKWTTYYKLWTKITVCGHTHFELKTSKWIHLLFFYIIQTYLHITLLY